MGKFDRVQTLMEQRMDKLTAYGQATEALLGCDADSAEQYITERDRLASDVDRINAEIAELCAGEEQGAELLRTTQGEIPFAEVPEGMQPLFELAQRSQTLVYNISQQNPMITQRLEGFRHEAAEYMREKQNLPKIKKYLTDLGQGDIGSQTNSKV